MAYAAPWRPGLCPGIAPSAPIAVGAFAQYARPALGPSLGQRHAPTASPAKRRHVPARRPVVFLAAAAAAGAFKEETFGASLRRQAQKVLYSPHDKEIWSVALPALVAMLLEPIMNALNAGLVGHLGTHQLSAVSLGGLAVSLCTFFYTFLLFLTVPEIAAAVVKKNEDEVSCIAAKSLWIAGVCGVVSSAAMYLGAGAIVGVLNPPEAAVAAYATEYIRIRSLGIPAVLLGFVATAVFRGFKDTRTPLLGAVLSAAASLGLNCLFLYVLQMGVVGSAWATSAAQLVSCGLLLTALLRGGRVQARHLRRPPPLSAMLPTLKLGAVLGARNIISFGMVMYASALSIRLGSTYQASFEVIRQLWIVAIQFFECLNVATQALCATYLGKEDRSTALVLLNRLLTLGMGIGALAGCAVWALQEPLISFFTRDPMVVQQVLATLPMICGFFFIDAAASIMDGSLLAAKQSNYMSAVQIAGSVLQYGVLSYLATTGNVTTLTVWSALKILGVVRVFSGVARNYFSPKSGYTPIPASPQEPAVQPLLAARTDVSTAAKPAAVHTQPSAAAAGVAAISATAEAVAATAKGSAGEESLKLPQSWSEPLLPPSEPSTSPGRLSLALQSFEDDVMVLACAACTSATDMQPDMLGLKRRHSDVDGAAAMAGVRLALEDGGGGGGGGDGSSRSDSHVANGNVGGGGGAAEDVVAVGAATVTAAADAAR